MIKKIEFYNKKHDDKTKCIMYLVTPDSENELKEIKSKIGIVHKKFSILEFKCKKNVKYIFAKVGEMCPNVLGQVLEYADICGIQMSYIDICTEVEKMIKEDIEKNNI